MTLARCPWYVAGPLIGLLMISLRAALNKPLGALGGYIDLAENARTPRRLGVGAFVILGVVLGGTLFTIMTGAWAPAFQYGSAAGHFWRANPIAESALLIVAGIAMGYGARTAGGCTSGHGMTGMSLGSPASIVATMTFFATAVALARAWTWLGAGAW